MTKTEGIKVSSLLQLKQALLPFLPGKEADDVTVIEANTKDIQSNDDSIIANSIVSASITHANKRKMLLQGMDLVKKQREVFKQQSDQDDTDFGGFIPVRIKEQGMKFSWVDLLIKRCLDGKRRVDDTIEWQLPEGMYVFEPYAGILKKE